jgi:Transposase DDE domain group 1
MLLAALANTLMHRLRALARQATELERASTATIRVRLLKIGAAILRNTRRVRVMLASHHPLREPPLRATWPSSAPARKTSYSA